MSRLLLLSSQSDYLIRVFDKFTYLLTNSVDPKPTDLDLHCLLRQGMSCSSREELKELIAEGIATVSFNNIIGNETEPGHIPSLNIACTSSADSDQSAG